MKKLQYFVGKVCTIFVTPINRNFKEENPASFPQQMYVYFLGIVESIDEDGVWLIQLHKNLKSFWKHEQIVGIAEEEMLNPDDESDAAEIDKIKKSDETARNNLIKENPYIDPVALANLAKS
jgi:hypothetical protein